eukprot:scaffold855_cov140-Skeletonema_menzelii.AAC.12
MHHVGTSVLAHKNVAQTTTERDLRISLNSTLSGFIELTQLINALVRSSIVTKRCLFLPFLDILIIMTTSYSCDADNLVFKSLEVDYSDADKDGKVKVSVTADSTWNADTKATIVGKMGKSKWEAKGIELCSYITSGNCGGDGALVFEFDPTAMDASLSLAMIEQLDNLLNIEVVAKPDGKAKEKCTESSSLPTSFQTASNPMVAGSASIVSTLFGAVALVGLAAYAWKRRDSAMSKNGADERLYGGDLA